MRLERPRVEPLPESELDPEIRERFGDGPVLHIFRTLARHPKLLKRWLVFGNHVLGKSTLSPRERELAILRVGWLRRAGYEWEQHVRIARAEGVSDEEIERVASGPAASGWSETESLLLRATDELIADAFVQEETWQGLSAHYTVEQLLDLIFTVGQYDLVSMALNSLGVQLESGERPRWPEPESA